MNINMTYTAVERGCAAILRPTNTLDWSSYQNLIAQAWAAHSIGTHHLIVDLSDIERIGIAGMVGLYAVARVAQGVPPPDVDAGWEAVRALVEDGPLARCLAVVNPRPPVSHVLEDAPFSDFLAIYADLGAALAALVA